MLEMDKVKEMINDIFNIENIDEIRFKTIEINPHKIIYFIFHENCKIVDGRLISGSVEPKAFILKMDEEYYYCPLDDEKFDENLVKKFSKNL